MTNFKIKTAKICHAFCFYFIVFYFLCFILLWLCYGFITQGDSYAIISLSKSTTQSTYHNDMDSYVEDIRGAVFPGLRAPCNTCVSGATGSGKTTLVRKILQFKDVIYDHPVHEVLYCMSVDQPLFAEMRKSVTGLKFRRGIPSEEDLNMFTDGSRHCIVVLDDLMEQVVKSVEAQNLFTKYSHHKFISVLYISQNMYAQGKCSRNLSMNTHYFFALCNLRDVGQIKILAKQTGLGDALNNSYKDCVLKKAYGYQLISLHPGDVGRHLSSNSPRLTARIFTNIFPGENLISYI